MSIRNSTRIHNLSFLKTEVGCSQLRNSTIFMKNDFYFISPAVSEGTHGKYWVDIREVNLAKVNPSKCFFLPRIVPNLFIIEHYKNIKSFLSDELMEFRLNSGNVWGIYMEINLSEMKAILFSKKNSETTLITKLINKEALFQSINSVRL